MDLQVLRSELENHIFNVYAVCVCVYYQQDLKVLIAETQNLVSYI